jgi:uncharacterized protein GlcG (DUF336 family)
VSRITLDQANIITSGAFAKGKELKLKPLAIAVLDAGSHLIACQRQDGASTGRVQVATGKAAGALFFGISSRKIGEIAAERPVFVTSLAAVAPAGMIPAAGGVIVVDDAGAPLGAVGISGDISDNDEICALAGITAARLNAQSH